MKKSRLYVSKRKRRNYVALIFLVTLLCAACYQLELQYGVAGKIVRFYRQIENAGEGTAALNRGSIYDRHYAVLATNVEKLSVYCRTREIESPAEDALLLADILGEDPRQLRARLESHSLRSWLAEGITEEQEGRLRAADLSGIYFESQSVRHYPQNELAAHLTGFTEDEVGLAGVESYFDRLLSGVALDLHEESSLKAVEDIILTVDLKIQRVVRNYLLSLMRDDEVVRAAAYVIQSESGALIAGAQVPGYDPNRYREYPGTAFDSMFLQSVPVPQKFRKFFNETAEIFNLSQENDAALPWSLSVKKKNLGGELLLWDWLGLDSNWQADFALLQTDSVARSQYQAVSPEKDIQSSVPEKVSPLELLAAFAAITGSGKPVRVHVIDRVIDSSGNEFALDHPKILENSPLNPVALRMREEVVRLVEADTSRHSRLTHVLHDEQPLVRTDPDGKRQIFKQEMVFEPFSGDSENLALLLVIEKKGYTTQFARRNFPGLNSLVKRVSALQHVAESLVGMSAPEQGDRLQVMADSAEEPMSRPVIEETIDQDMVMPDLQGLSLRKSMQLLKGFSCLIQVEGIGWVRSQYPPAGASLASVETCRVTLQPPLSQRREVLAGRMKLAVVDKTGGR